MVMTLELFPFSEGPLKDLISCAGPTSDLLDIRQLTVLFLWRTLLEQTPQKMALGTSGNLVRGSFDVFCMQPISWVGYCHGDLWCFDDLDDPVPTCSPFGRSCKAH